MRSKEVVLGVTGSIAAYRACEIISRLRRNRIKVTVAMTKEAEEFITPLTFQTLSGNKVVRELFALPDNVRPLHIALARSCDLLLVAPATANIVAKLAAGIADDVISCLALSTAAPVVVCCAMNEKMFRHKITQDNIARLKRLGFRFIGPRRGHLVCGDVGLGHLAEVTEIVGAVVRILKR